MKTILVNIENVGVGDTIIHNDKMMTVCRNNITYIADIGRTLFGDSYMLGYKKVERVIQIGQRRI